MFQEPHADDIAWVKKHMLSYFEDPHREDLSQYYFTGQEVRLSTIYSVLSQYYLRGQGIKQSTLLSTLIVILHRI